MSAKSFKVCWHEPERIFRPPISPAEIAFNASTKVQSGHLSGPTKSEQ